MRGNQTMEDQNKNLIITLIDEMKEEEVLEKFLGLNGIEDYYSRLTEIFDSSGTYQEIRRQCLSFVHDFSQLFDSRFYPNFSQMYEGFLNLEEVLYQFDENYRDHLYHSLSIFILLIYILYPILQSKQFFKKSPFLAIHSTPLHSLLTIGIMHDIGYPIEKYNIIYQKLAGLFEKYPQLMINTSELQLKDQIRLMVADYIGDMIENEEFINRDAYGLSKNDRKVLYLHAWEQRRHGIVAALYVLYLYRWHNLLEADRAIPEYSEGYKSYHMAASAIALHDERFSFLGSNPSTKGIKKNFCIKFELTPYTFLLRLLDEIQDWHRSSFIFPDFYEKPHFVLDHLKVKIEHDLIFLEIDISTDSEKIAIGTKLKEMKTNLTPLYSSVFSVKVKISQRNGENIQIVEIIEIGLIKVSRILDGLIEKNKGKEVSAHYFLSETMQVYPCVINNDINRLLIQKGCTQTVNEGKRYYLVPE